MYCRSKNIYHSQYSIVWFKRFLKTTNKKTLEQIFRNFVSCNTFELNALFFWKCSIVSFKYYLSFPEIVVWFSKKQSSSVCGNHFNLYWIISDSNGVADCNLRAGFLQKFKAKFLEFSWVSRCKSWEFPGSSLNLGLFSHLKTRKIYTVLIILAFIIHQKNTQWRVREVL